MKFVIPIMIWLLMGCSVQANASASASGQDSFVLIYNGSVSAEDGPEAVAAMAMRLGLKTRFISDMAELPRLLKDTAVFIIGGTVDDITPLIDSFTPKVTEALRAYLRNGGRYLGICGGGFMASAGWQEAKGFVKTLGIIPAKSSDFDNNFAPRILSVKWLGEIRPMYFQYGPAFDLIPTSEAVRVIAYYKDGRIAALISSYSQGKVAVSGPHPEARESWRDQVSNGSIWVPSTDLADDLLRELLSDRPVRP